MKKQNKFAFTLIELLVVITIIGILATTGVAIFTKQLQGARDSTRVNDLKLLESAAVQYFSDNDEYPEASGATTGFTGLINQYISKQVTDPRQGKTVCWGGSSDHSQPCYGYYKRTDDSYGLPNAAFKLGILFEKQENFEDLATNTGSKGDGGNVDFLYEVYAGAGAQGTIWSGVNTGTIDTNATKVY